MEKESFVPPPLPAETSPGRIPTRFLGLILLSLLVYAGLAGFYSTRLLSGTTTNKEIACWIATLSLLFLYWKTAQVVQQDAVPLRWVVLSGLALGLVAFLIPPFHSTDIFGYINRGWQQLHYSLNPYVYTIAQVPGWEHDRMITDHWVNNPSPYGFLYLLIAKGLCALGAGVKSQTVTVFKASNVGVYAATAALIGLGASRLQHQWPESRPTFAVFLYLANPLVLIHSIANGHNDIWMGFFLTLSAYFALIGAWLWIIPALIAATLIKYGALVVIPIALLFLIKQKAWKALFGGILLGLLVFGITGLPYLGDWQAFHLKEISRNAFVSHGSLHSVVYSLYKTIGTEWFPALTSQREVIRAVLKNILLGGFLLMYTGWGIRRFRQTDYTVTEWIHDALLFMLLLVTLVSLKFYPWYLGMFFPLAFYLREGDWLRRFTVALSGTQLFSITFIGQAHVLNYLVMTGLPIGGIALPALGFRRKQIILGFLAVITGALTFSLLLGAALSMIAPLPMPTGNNTLDTLDDATGRSLPKGKH